MLLEYLCCPEKSQISCIKRGRRGVRNYLNKPHTKSFFYWSLHLMSSSIFWQVFCQLRGMTFLVTQSDSDYFSLFSGSAIPVSNLIVSRCSRSGKCVARHKLRAPMILSGRISSCDVNCQAGTRQQAKYILFRFKFIIELNDLYESHAHYKFISCFEDFLL